VINARTFEGAHVEDTCPACGQGLPADRVEAAHAEALAQFNAKKAKDLQANNEAGASLAARQKALRAEAQTARTALENQKSGLGQLQGKVKNLSTKADEAKAAPVKDAASTPEYAKLRAEADQLRAAI